MCCDAELNRVVTRGASTILDYGTTTRLASDSQYYALVARDGGCRWPGCDRPPGWCQVHHIDEVFLEDGPTDLKQDVFELFNTSRLRPSPRMEIHRRHRRPMVRKPDGTLMAAPCTRTSIPPSTTTPLVDA